MIAALSFDDGPDGRWTPQILDLLYDAEVHATFFVLGAHIATNDHLLVRMRDEGHDIGVHSWYHAHLPNLRDEPLEDDFSDCRVAIHAATGAAPTLWRAPYLDTDERVNTVAASFGLTHVNGKVCGDWNETDPQRIAQRALDGLQDGDTLILHDGLPLDGGSGTRDRQPSVDALALLLDTPGLRFCSVSELA